MAENHGHESDPAHTPGVESFEVTYWADRFGVSTDLVREVISELDASGLNDSILERLG